MWNSFQPPSPIHSTCSIFWLIVNALRGKWMWSWLFTQRGRESAIMIKNKKCQQLIWYLETWLSDRLTYNPRGVMLPCSLLAKCQRPTWLLSYTVWYPQAALRDTAEVQRFKLTVSVSLKPVLHTCLDKMRVKTSHTSLLFTSELTITSYNRWFIRISGLNNTIMQQPYHLWDSLPWCEI